jgi:hypothetical protein
LSRIDIFVDVPDGKKVIGSLATDEAGQFRGQVTLPGSLPVGRFKVGAELGGVCRAPAQ